MNKNPEGVDAQQESTTTQEESTSIQEAARVLGTSDEALLSFLNRTGILSDNIQIRVKNILGVDGILVQSPYRSIPVINSPVTINGVLQPYLHKPDLPISGGIKIGTEVNEHGYSSGGYIHGGTSIQ